MSCCDHDCSAPETDYRYQRILWVAFTVNLAMFGIELVASIVAGSVSLRADALDFLGDAANYAVALAVDGARAALARAGGTAERCRHGPVRPVGCGQHH